jgi:hypothetical protein
LIPCWPRKDNFGGYWQVASCCTESIKFRELNCGNVRMSCSFLVAIVQNFEQKANWYTITFDSENLEVCDSRAQRRQITWKKFVIVISTQWKFVANYDSTKSTYQYLLLISCLIAITVTKWNEYHKESQFVIYQDLLPTFHSIHNSIRFQIFATFY